MRVLYLLNGGIGNVMEQTPTYLRLREELGAENVDVEYYAMYPSEGVHNAQCFPCNVIPLVTPEQMAERQDEVEKKYDYIIRGWRVFRSDGGYIREYEDAISELDSEVEKSQKCLDAIGIDRGEMLREWREKECDVPTEPYVVMHNGALAASGWEGKRYPKMSELAWRIQRDLGIRVVSVGAKHEYNAYTTDLTGRSLRETAYTIRSSMAYVGTDTGTYHIAGLVGVGGVAIFTMTSQIKNYDARFHHSITTIQRSREELPCCPCQWGWCWSPESASCKEHKCQDISVDEVFEVVKHKLVTNFTSK